MAYDLFFLSEFPALGIRMPLEEWVALPVPNPPVNADIRRFLGTASRWRPNKVGHIGYGGITQVFTENDGVELRFPLHRRTLRRSMLTLSFLVSVPRGWGELRKSAECAIWLDVGNTLRWQSVSGQLSHGFKEGLARITKNDLALVRADMERAWKATAPRMLLPMRHFGIGVHDGRFEIGFSDGSGCDVSMYPDDTRGFSCHNLDSVLQQAVCLAGLFSLYERVKKKC